MITQRIGQLPALLGITQSDFERKLGMSQGVLRKALIKNTHISSKWVEKISEIFPVNIHWVATGEGNPLLEDDFLELRIRESNEEYRTSGVTNLEALPLVPQSMLKDFTLTDDTSEFLYYSIPDFSFKKGNFLVRLNDDSLLPRYKGGSLFICKIIEDAEIIWGKAFVICSKSGILLRRLFPKDGDTAYVNCRADNTNYPSFDLKRSDITRIHMVEGVISFE